MFDYLWELNSAAWAWAALAVSAAGAGESRAALRCGKSSLNLLYAAQLSAQAINIKQGADSSLISIKCRATKRETEREGEGGSKSKRDKGYKCGSYRGACGDVWDICNTQWKRERAGERERQRQGRPVGWIFIVCHNSWVENKLQK